MEKKKGLKRAKSATRRVVRGAVGPSKKTLKRTREGLMRQVAASLRKEYEGVPPRHVIEERANERAQRLESRMSAKYALDALNVRDSKKRHRIYEAFGEVVRKRDRAKLHDQGIQPVVANRFAAIAIEELGTVKGAIFVKLCMRKWKRVRNYFQ